MRADFRYFGADALQPLFNQRFQRLAFRFARDDKVIEVPSSAAKISAAIASDPALAPP